MVAELKKPRFDLRKAQQQEPIIGAPCARRACLLLRTSDVAAARRHARRLFKALVASDFAHVETMRQRSGPPKFGDVYGKRDSYGVWFIKVEVVEGTTVLLLSCHEAEKPLELADGRVLRKKP